MKTYHPVIRRETKKCTFVKNDETGERGFAIHNATFIDVKDDNEVCVSFKFTQRGNIYDSRDSKIPGMYGKKPVDSTFVYAELERILGPEQAALAYAEANQPLVKADKPKPQKADKADKVDKTEPKAKTAEEIIANAIALGVEAMGLLQPQASGA